MSKPQVTYEAFLTFLDNAVHAVKNEWKSLTGEDIPTDQLYALNDQLDAFFEDRCELSEDDEFEGDDDNWSDVDTDAPMMPFFTYDGVEVWYVHWQCGVPRSLWYVFYNNGCQFDVRDIWSEMGSDLPHPEESGDHETLIRRYIDWCRERLPESEWPWNR